MCMSACDSVCELAYIGMHTTVCIWRSEYSIVQSVCFQELKLDCQAFMASTFMHWPQGFFGGKGVILSNSYITLAGLEGALPASASWFTSVIIFIDYN